MSAQQLLRTTLRICVSLEDWRTAVCAFNLCEAWGLRPTDTQYRAVLGIVALCGEWEEAIEYRGGAWYRNYRVETRPWYGGAGGDGQGEGGGGGGGGGSGSGGGQGFGLGGGGGDGRAGADEGSERRGYDDDDFGEDPDNYYGYDDDSPR